MLWVLWVNSCVPMVKPSMTIYVTTAMGTYIAVCLISCIEAINTVPLYWQIIGISTYAVEGVN